MGKSNMNKVWLVLIKYFTLLYLQFLYLIGAFQNKKTWIDNHIIMCYNKLKQLGLDIPQDYYKN